MGPGDDPAGAFTRARQTGGLVLGTGAVLLGVDAAKRLLK